MTSPLQAVDTDDGRFYFLDGRKHMSVTTVLDKAIPKPALFYWGSKVVAEEAATMIEMVDAGGGFYPRGRDLIRHLRDAPIRYRDERGRIGDEVHGYAESRLLGVLGPSADCIADKQVRWRCKQVDRWLSDFKVEPLHVEATVYSEVGYAGSCDLMALVDGVPTIVDFKTSKSVYPTVALQLAAYRWADYIITDDGEMLDMPEFDRAAVLHIKPRSYKLIEMDAGFGTFDCFIEMMDYIKTLDHIDDAGIIGDINPKESA